jgi:hypothetical protein
LASVAAPARPFGRRSIAAGLQSRADHVLALSWSAHLWQRAAFEFTLVLSTGPQ